METDRELPGTLLEDLSGFPARVREAARRVPASALGRAAAEGGFSLLERACHLRGDEKERCLGRIRRILGEVDPFLVEIVPEHDRTHRRETEDLLDENGAGA